MDPIVELYDKNGTLITRVDRSGRPASSWPRSPSAGRTVVYVRVLNYYANGNRLTYAVTPTFVDTVAPVATIRVPVERRNRGDPMGDGGGDIQRGRAERVELHRAVRDLGVEPDRPRIGLVRLREARGAAAAHLTADSVTTTIGWSSPPPSRIGRKPLAPSRAGFTTSNYAFRDIQGTPYAAADPVDGGRPHHPGLWLRTVLPDGQGASGWSLRRPRPRAGTSDNRPDPFTDDDGEPVTKRDQPRRRGRADDGCATGRFCPRTSSGEATWPSSSCVPSTCRRPPSDFFTDDEASPPGCRQPRRRPPA